jgi:uncharacterized protein involved in exopolysaccharide biosynthesis
MTIAFTVAFEDERPETAMRVANEFITMFLSEDVRSRTSQASETTKFLTRETSRLESELRGIEVQLSEFKRQHAHALPARPGFEQSALDERQKNLAELDDALRQLDEEKRLVESGSLLPVFSGSTEDMAKRLAGLRMDLLQSTSLYSEGHPNVRAIRLQINALEREIAGGRAGKATSRSDKGGTAVNLNAPAFKQRLADIETRRSRLVEQRAAAVSTLAGMIAQSSEAETKLLALERQQATIQRNLEEASRKLSAARLGESLERDQQSERFEVIENPSMPQSSKKPNRLILLALAFGMAMMAGVGGVFAAEMVDKSIRGRRDLYGIVDSDLLVAIPYVSTRREEAHRKSRITLVVGSSITILVGLAAIYFTMPSIGNLLKSFTMRLIG